MKCEGSRRRNHLHLDTELRFNYYNKLKANPQLAIDNVTDLLQVSKMSNLVFLHGS